MNPDIHADCERRNFMYYPDIQSKIEMISESAKQEVADFVELLLSRYVKVLRKRSVKGKNHKSDIAGFTEIGKTASEEIDRDIAPYHKVSHLIGTAESGIGDLGQNHREHLRKKIRKNL